MTETVTVSAELPVIDKTQTNTQTTVDSKFTQKLAVGRSYQSILQLAPGVTGGANPNVHGALNQENVFLFDGVDTTDTTTGTFGQNFNYEAIQEVNVNTGNFSAEYGRASGGVISVVTKSGGNDFHGSAKAIATNDQWNGQNYQTSQTTGASLARTKFDEVQWREAFTLGGPFFRDHLWFFGSYELAKTTTRCPPDGSAARTTSRRRTRRSGARRPRGPSRTSTRSRPRGTAIRSPGSSWTTGA